MPPSGDGWQNPKKNRCPGHCGRWKSCCSLTAMLVNGAGAFSSVIAAVKLESLSFSSIIEQFGDLPATSQAALVMALLSAFIIPIGALVAGDGLAALALERRTTSNPKEQAWQEVEFMVVYRALYGRYLQ
jgi:hypothetical protein